jgi:hypothetical protein
MASTLALIPEPNSRRGTSFEVFESRMVSGR